MSTFATLRRSNLFEIIFQLKVTTSNNILAILQFSFLLPLSRTFTTSDFKKQKLLLPLLMLFKKLFPVKLLHGEIRIWNRELSSVEQKLLATWKVWIFPHYQSQFFTLQGQKVFEVIFPTLRTYSGCLFPVWRRDYDTN